MALIPMHNPFSPATFMSDSHEALLLPLLTYTHDDTFSKGAIPTSGIDPIEQPEGMLHPANGHALNSGQAAKGSDIFIFFDFWAPPPLFGRCRGTLRSLK